MIKIMLVGSNHALDMMKVLLNESAIETSITKDETQPDATIYEIDSVQTLFKTPKSFTNPAFLYITNNNKELLDNVKSYAVNGLLFPPLTTVGIMSKITNLSLMKPSKIKKEEHEVTRIKIIAKSESIPPLPALAQELIKLTRDDSTSITQLTDSIKMDQGISTAIVKLVNSPFYGIKQDISSIDRATALLGFNSIKNIAIASSMNSYYLKNFAMYKTTGNEMWKHSYNVACVAQIIGKQLELDHDSLYLAGLLHDIGKVVLVDFIDKPVNYIEDEQNQIGFDHAEIGSTILEKWALASEVTEAVKTHHDFDANTFGKILYFANKIDNNKESADEIIREMQLVFGITDSNIVSKKILAAINDDNEVFR